MQTNKAWVALAGAAATGLLATYTGMPAELTVTIGALITGFLTWAIPNAVKG